MNLRTGTACADFQFDMVKNQSSGKGKEIFINFLVTQLEAWGKIKFPQRFEEDLENQELELSLLKLEEYVPFCPHLSYCYVLLEEQLSSLFVLR